MAQAPGSQTRFTGTLHCDGGFTFGDPTNPFVIISATTTDGTAFVDTTSGAQDESNPVLGQFDPTKSAPATPTPAGTALSLTDTFKRPTNAAGKVVNFVTPQANIADLTAAPTAADVNHLLAVLRAAGVLTPSMPEPPAAPVAPAPAPTAPAPAPTMAMATPAPAAPAPAAASAAPAPTAPAPAAQLNAQPAAGKPAG